MIQISNKTECCGCTACFSVCPKNCITMQYDEEGFLYPAVDSRVCVNCHACEKVCPLLKSDLKESHGSIYAAVQYQEESKRLASTAGGAFSLIADHLIDRGAVVYAVGYDENAVVCHKYADTKEAIAELRGSKYVQSQLNDVYRQIKRALHDGKTVLFVGTPCQVHGLKRYTGEDENLYTIDLLCLGVTSPVLFRKYIEYLTKKYGEKVTQVQFRNKHYGYATANVRVCFDSGKYIEQNYDSKVHANLFFRHYYNVRPSCYVCKFREIPRVSDFTIGDFTEIGKHSKEMDDDKGTTKLWAHSEKGKKLINELREKQKILQLEENASNIVGGPERQIRQPERRSEFFQDAGRMEYQSLIRKWEPKSIKGELINVARRMINQLPFRSLIFKKLRLLRSKKYHNRVRELNR